MKPQIYAQEQYGPLFFGPKTKELVKWLPFGSYALLDHEDIDEMAALSLIQKKVKGVLNYSSSMTGEYPSIGTQKLIQAHIPVYDVQDIEKLKSKFQQGNLIRIVKNRLWIDSMPDPITLLIPYTEERMELKMRESSLNIRESLKSFTENTLDYAYREMNEILKPIQIPPLRIHLRNRHVLVVTRGSGYMEDLKALTGYIQEKSPVLIGVDGGADAILECGYQPDMIIGDMDSVSEKALRSGAEIVVQAYSDGEAPGLELVQKFGITPHLFPCFGTSEDAAHLLAYEAGALLIVTLGSHTNMIDFLEKGRKGMGSTLLVRLKIGEKLIDAKGVSYLYPEALKTPYLAKVQSMLGLL